MSHLGGTRARNRVLGREDDARATYAIPSTPGSRRSFDMMVTVPFTSPQIRQIHSPDASTIDSRSHRTARKPTGFLRRLLTFLNSSSQIDFRDPTTLMTRESVSSFGTSYYTALTSSSYFSSPESHILPSISDRLSTQNSATFTPASISTTIYIPNPKPITRDATLPTDAPESGKINLLPGKVGFTDEDQPLKYNLTPQDDVATILTKFSEWGMKKHLNEKRAEGLVCMVCMSDLLDLQRQLKAGSLRENGLNMVVWFLIQRTDCLLKWDKPNIYNGEEIPTDWSHIKKMDLEIEADIAQDLIDACALPAIYRRQMRETLREKESTASKALQSIWFKVILEVIEPRRREYVRPRRSNYPAHFLFGRTRLGPLPTTTLTPSLLVSPHSHNGY